ncbi:hypothetical protein [Halovenus salina]|uniref:hypothetical protein n=1 Tax=Halovenus salina TaxID=1510225 RepID=UPI002260A78C|nr:hypothetical protein [Halovenus salina]
MVRPVSTEVLQDICEEIARENYGFVYLADHKSEIKEQYEQAETGFKYTNSLSLSNIKSGMQEIADDDFNSFERLRGDAYFVNPLDRGWGQRIGDELESLFTTNLVLHKKRLEKKFDIAPNDVDYFARKLSESGYIDRIPAGERDYFVGGSELKDETSRDIGLDAQLKSRADAEGKLSHRELEEIIDVAATENVIDYLSQNDFIIDLDGEYLVQAALDEFAHSLADRIADQVTEEFQESEYVLHQPEFEQVIENNINESTTILKEARAVRQKIIARTEDALTEELDLSERAAYNMVVMSDPKLDGQGFAELVDEQARAVKKQVARSDVTITKRSEQLSAGEERIADLQLGRTQKSREFIRDEIQERYEEMVDQEW